MSTDRLIQDGELVLLDMGTEVRLATANSSTLGGSLHVAAGSQQVHLFVNRLANCICCTLRCQINISFCTMSGASRLVYSSRLLLTRSGLA